MSAYQRKLFATRGKGKSRPRRPMGDYTAVKRSRPTRAAPYPQMMVVAPEMKHFDDGIDLQSDALWVWENLTCASIRSGLAGNERIGARIRIKRISFRGYYVQDAAKTTGQAELVRVAVFVDHQNAGANAVYSTWFQENDMFSHRAIQVPPRGSILHDEVFEVIPAIAGADNQPLHHVQFSVACDFEVNYVTDTGAVTDTRGNTLFLGVCSFNKAGASEGDLVGNLRIAFQDI